MAVDWTDLDSVPCNEFCISYMANKTVSKKQIIKQTAQV